MRLHWPLISLAILFLLPFFAAIFLLATDHPFTTNSVEHGTIIQPAKHLPLPNIEHKWQIVYVQPTNCSAECIAQKELLQKLHIALGAQRERVAIVNIHSEELSIDIQDNDVLIIDPNNMYIMHYAANTNYQGILKDVRRLLKYSHAI